MLALLPKSASKEEEDAQRAKAETMYSDTSKVDFKLDDGYQLGNVRIEDCKSWCETITRYIS